MSEIRVYRFFETDPGYCRVYYKKPDGGLVCFQEEGQDNFIFLSCSRDGEPCSPYRPDWIGYLDELPEGQESTSVSFRNWVAASPHWTVGIPPETIEESP